MRTIVLAMPLLLAIPSFAQDKGTERRYEKQQEAHPHGGSRRLRLEPRERAECHSLERSIISLEAEAREANHLRLRQIQQELDVQRERYQALHC